MVSLCFSSDCRHSSLESGLANSCIRPYSASLARGPSASLCQHSGHTLCVSACMCEKVSFSHFPLYIICQEQRVTLWVGKQEINQRLAENYCCAHLNVLKVTPAEYLASIKKLMPLPDTSLWGWMEALSSGGRVGMQFSRPSVKFLSPPHTHTHIHLHTSFNSSASMIVRHCFTQVFISILDCHKVRGVGHKMKNPPPPPKK